MGCGVHPRREDRDVATLTARLVGENGRVAKPRDDAATKQPAETVLLPRRGQRRRVIWSGAGKKSVLPLAPQGVRARGDAHRVVVGANRRSRPGMTNAMPAFENKAGALDTPIFQPG